MKEEILVWSLGEGNDSIIKENRGSISNLIRNILF